MVRPSNYVIVRAGFTLGGAPGTLVIFAKPSLQIQVRPKNAVSSEHGTYDTVLYGKSVPGYCITFIKRLDGGLRLQRLEQKA